MRTYSLINANGERYSLTDSSKAFIYNAAGLGFTGDNTYQRVGNHFNLLRSRFKQQAISGNIHFFGENAQTEYENFVKFTQIKPLILAYNPVGDKEYYCQGTFSEVAYAEKNKLMATVKFMPHTPFYESIKVVTYPYSEITEGKIYNYTYPYSYSSATANTVVIESVSDDCPCKITIYGHVINPVWKHYVNNVLYATGKITGDIPSSNRLVIDTTGDDFSMIEYDSANNVVRNMYQESDFGTERAIYLMRGKNRVSIEDDTGGRVTVAMEGEIYHASV